MTTTNEIADKIAGDHGLTKAQSKAIVEAVFSAITAAAGSGNETSIPGFGKFKVKDMPEREAHDQSSCREKADLHTGKSSEGCLEQIAAGYSAE